MADRRMDAGWKNVLFFLNSTQWFTCTLGGDSLINKLFCCFIQALHHFQQSFSHIVTMSGCGRKLNAHF